MTVGKNELIQRLFLLVQHERCCANFGGNEKNDRILPRQRYRYAEAWLYFTKTGIICLHKSTDANFNPFREGDEDLLQRLREGVVGGPSTVFTRRAVVDETFIRNSTNLLKYIVGIDASQLYTYSMCQPMPNGLYTH